VSKLSDDEREAEIKRRKGAGSLALPNSNDGPDATSYVISTETELRTVSQGGVYRVLRPEDIDPDVTAKNVTWMIQRELTRGSNDPIVARTLGQLYAFTGTLVYSAAVLNMMSRHVVSIAKTLANAADRLDACRSKLDSLAGSVARARPSALSIEPLEGFDGSCRAFFLFSKAAITACTGLLVDGFGLNAEPGNFRRIVDELSRVSLDAADRLKQHDKWCKQLTDARNAIEHPMPDNWFETRNFMLAPDGVVRPTFRHHIGGTPPPLNGFRALRGRDNGRAAFSSGRRNR
jgi:hypothetical protein